MADPCFISAADAFDDWRDDVLTGGPPVLFPVVDSSSTLSKLEIGPGLVTLIGGALGGRQDGIRHADRCRCTAADTITSSRCLQYRNDARRTAESSACTSEWYW